MDGPSLPSLFPSVVRQKVTDLCSLRTQQTLSGPSLSSYIESDVEFKHHRYAALQRTLRETAARCPNITRLYDIGYSVRGRALTVMEITDNPGVHEPGNGAGIRTGTVTGREPEFRYVANIHGNEPRGRELMLHLTRYLCERYLAGDKRITALIDNTRIHILTALNPDGYEVAAVIPNPRPGILSNPLSVSSTDPLAQPTTRDPIKSAIRIFYGSVGEMNDQGSYQIRYPYLLRIR
ncbi:hypothetical protein Bbelb_083230 [Branchiostoma belcheri]|nr:hypothetical protein Bbelb_083230 [Branchiostoma belcheri]